MELLRKLKKEIEELQVVQSRKEQQVMSIIKKLPVDSNLLFFYGKGCSYTSKVEPFIFELESVLGKRVQRLETWHDDANRNLYAEVGGHRDCGGVPFFYNRETKKSMCGAVALDALKCWANYNVQSK